MIQDGGSFKSEGWVSKFIFSKRSIYVKGMLDLEPVPGTLGVYSFLFLFASLFEANLYANEP